MGKSNHKKASQTKVRSIQTRQASAIPPATPENLRQQVLADFGVLRVPLDEQSLDEHLSRSEQEGLAPLQLLARIVGEQANRRRERAIERRIHEARFAEVCTLAEFDWQFNAQTIERGQIEQL